GPFDPGSLPRLRHGPPRLPTRQGIVSTLTASGFRLPWPPSGCLDELTPFVVSDERVFRHLNLAFGSSRIASSAYQKWPTSNASF
ncbi:hypothetical protein PENANT_c221G10769, partial [Penicillium antarcticum]